MFTYICIALLVLIGLVLAYLKLCPYTMPNVYKQSVLLELQINTALTQLTYFDDTQTEAKIAKDLLQKAEDQYQYVCADAGMDNYKAVADIDLGFKLLALANEHIKNLKTNN